MDRFNVIIILGVIGGLNTYQYLPVGDYCIGMINGLFFVVLIILYLIFLIYELYLNFQEIKYNKKKFDKTSVYLTVFFIIGFIVINHLDLFESKVIFKTNYENRGHNLELQENENFKYFYINNHETCYKFGEYKWKNDILSLKSNNKISLDTQYYLDKDKKLLIPINFSNLKSFKVD